MITEKEQQSTLLSATKKDYYQIWNELLDTAGKLSERWDPTTTNEADPGIVLLKVLTAIADKLNYNIDKNILEAFMPSAAQEDSMRKLCEMLGYTMKYYTSATTDATIYYNEKAENWQTEEVTGVAALILPIYTQLTNIDKNIVYTTVEQASFTKASSICKIPCIEGTVSFCEQNNNGIVTLSNLDDNNRYYLPTSQVAENGIFIYNISNTTWSAKWEQVANLNSQELKKKIYKFGYDSKKFLPYIEFPSDISSLISDGLSIAYVVTNGLNGNISANTLSSFETPTEWSISDTSENNIYNTTGVKHTADEFVCYNAVAALNGTDRESLNNAYKSFKKTVGTFNTLVTCRDYINKIYSLTESTTDKTPLVSNSIVTDIRDDINRAITICSFDNGGIKYSKEALTKTTSRLVTGVDADNVSHTITISEAENLMDNFDLILYPFKMSYNLKTKTDYDSTFKNAGVTTGNKVINALANTKTIAHTLKFPEDTDILCIKNYLKLNTKVSTNTRVNTAEWLAILTNIKLAIYQAFNARQLDFREEIPFDSLLSVIQNADTNIKNVSLDDPALYTSFVLANNKEYLFSTPTATWTDTDIIQKFTAAENETYQQLITDAARANYLQSKRNEAQNIYNKLAIRNILAGKVELFNYNKDFVSTVTEKKKAEYELIYPTNTTVNPKTIVSLEPEFQILNQNQDNKQPIVLDQNQIIQFRAKNFRTEVTYPAYVNYFINLNNSVIKYAKPATFSSLYDYLNVTRTATGLVNSVTNTYTYPANKLNIFMNKFGNSGSQFMHQVSETEAPDYVNRYGKIFTKKTLYLLDFSANAYNSINSAESDVYVIPSMLINETFLTNETVTYNLDKSKFDGKIYKLEEGLRCDPVTHSFNSTGVQLKVDDGPTVIVNNTTQVISNYIDLTRKATVDYSYYRLFTSSLALKNANCEDTIDVYIPVDTIEPNTNYFIYPFLSNTYAVWFNWLKQYVEFDWIDSSNVTLSGIYRNLGWDLSRTVGKLIDEAKNKYQLCTTWYSIASNPLLFYYVQTAHTETKDSSATIWGYTADGLGENAVYKSLTADSEYELGAGEFLCFNYTSATATTGEITETSTAATIATTSTPINVYYGPGTIIRSNFALLNSSTKRETSVYSKTDNYDFSQYLGSTYKEKVPGMYSLGSSEQIEIREPVSVYVYDENNTQAESFSPVYVYFNLTNNKDLVFLKAARLVNDAYVYDGRILEDGEYFWYTDKNKQTLTYCGSGCEVINHTNIEIKKTAGQNEVSTEDILSNGISIVPWITVPNLYMKDQENPTATDSYIQWNEYQYITLTDTDTLKNISENSQSDYINMTITKDWKECNSAEYISKNVESKLPALAVQNCNWSVRTLLAISVSSDFSQTLKSTPNYTTEKVVVNFKDSNNQSSSLELTDVTFKSNYTVNSMANTIVTTYDLYDASGKNKETIADFKLKVFEDSSIYMNEQSDQKTSLTLNNMNNYFTNFNFTTYNGPAFEDTTQEYKRNLQPFTRLYSIVSNRQDITNVHNFNLIMIYYQTKTEDALITNHAKIRVIPTSKSIREAAGYADSVKQIPFETIYNYYNTAEDTSWWQNRQNTRACRMAEQLTGISPVTITDETAYNTFAAQVKTRKGTVCCGEVVTNISADLGYLVTVVNGVTYQLHETLAFDASHTLYFGIADLGIDKDILYCLRPGINVIKIDDLATSINSFALEIYPGQDLNDTITFGQPDSIVENITSTDSDLGLNLTLLGIKSSDNLVTAKRIAGQELLNNINLIDTKHNFYYNSMIDNSLSIDINAEANETLSDPAVWYDYNNINNKFVISEVDSDYLDTGITLTKSSKK